MITVAIVDDQPLFAQGMAMLVDAQADMRCIGIATDGVAAIQLGKTAVPDVIVMDLRMPVVNGVEATRRIARDRARPDAPPRIVVLTTIRQDEAVLAAFRAGADAFLTKDAHPDEVLDTIRSAADDSALPGAARTITVIGSARGRPGPAARTPPPAPIEALAALTAREHEVLLTVAAGLSNQQIAESLFLSEATVKTHIRSLLRKLDASSRTQLVVIAYESGVVNTRRTRARGD